LVRNFLVFIILMLQRKERYLRIFGVHQQLRYFNQITVGGRKGEIERVCVLAAELRCDSGDATLAAQIEGVEWIGGLDGGWRRRTDGAGPGTGEAKKKCQKWKMAGDTKEGRRDVHPPTQRETSVETRDGAWPPAAPPAALPPPGPTKQHNKQPPPPATSSPLNASIRHPQSSKRMYPQPPNTIPISPISDLCIPRLMCCQHTLSLTQRRSSILLLS
jgi:hypothetical protein